MAELAGQVVLITGSGRGIGRRCVEMAVDQGAHVIAVARSRDDLLTLQEYKPDAITIWDLDVTGDEILSRIAELEALHIVINNAGGNKPEPFIEVADNDLDRMIDLNMRSVFRISQAAARHMLDKGTKGAIIQMSSQMGHVGSPNRSVYCMTKHAIEGLTKSMAVELAEAGIRVNSIAPTFVETALTKPMLENPEFHSFVMNMIPMKKLATIDDVVNAALFLASSKAAMITGHSLKVDGGWTAQ